MENREECAMKKASSQKETSTEIAKVEVVGAVAVSESSKNNEAVRAEIRDSIQDSDPGLAKMWDLVTSVADPNEMLLINLQEFQVIHRQAQNEYWAGLKRNDAHLTRLLEQGDEYYDDYKKAQSEFNTQAMLDRKHISDLAKTLKQLAQEYRQCAMQKKYNIHISKVIEWRMAMESTINRNVLDVNVRRAISRDMLDAGRMLEPVSDEG